MKKIILVLNPAKVDLLTELGFSSCGKRHIGDGKVGYQYILTDGLHKALKANKFSKRDYILDSKMTF